MEKDISENQKFILEQLIDGQFKSRRNGKNLFDEEKLKLFLQENELIKESIGPVTMRALRELGKIETVENRISSSLSIVELWVGRMSTFQDEIVSKNRAFYYLLDFLFFTILRDKYDSWSHKTFDRIDYNKDLIYKLLEQNDALLISQVENNEIPCSTEVLRLIQEGRESLRQLLGYFQFRKLNLFPLYQNDTSLISIDRLGLLKSIDIRSCSESIAINVLIQLGEVQDNPLEWINSYSENMRKAHDAINSEYSDDTEHELFIIFDMTSPPDESVNTFVATNREKIGYVSVVDKHKIFMAVDYYWPENFSFSAGYPCFSDHRVPRDYGAQSMWEAFSQRIMNDLCTQFFNVSAPPKKLSTVLSWLGEKRQVIAQRLRHKRGEAYKFGVPRISESSYYYTERVSKHAGWSILYPAILERTKKLPITNRYKTTDGLIVDVFNDDGFSIIGFEKMPSKESCDAIVASDQYICSKAYYGHKKNQYGIPSKRVNYEDIYVRHPTISSEAEFDRMCEEYQKDYELIFLETNSLAILKALGRLAYSLFRTMPFSLGTCSIVEWMMGAIIKYKAIEINYQTSSDALHFDWEAFFTPNREDYALWFANILSPAVNLTKKGAPLSKMTTVFCVQEDDRDANDDMLQSYVVKLTNATRSYIRINFPEGKPPLTPAIIFQSHGRSGYIRANDLLTKLDSSDETNQSKICFALEVIQKSGTGRLSLSAFAKQEFSCDRLSDLINFLENNDKKELSVKSKVGYRRH